MRSMALAVFLAVSAAWAQQPDTSLNIRFGYEANELKYPQKTPKDTLASVIQTVDGKNINYLMAHLADPKFVDDKVVAYTQGLSGREESKAQVAFARLVKETTEHFLEDPLLLNELRLFAREGEWKEEGTTASISHKSLPGRSVFMKKINERWFLENRQQ
jgi:hypothetical protein